MGSFFETLLYYSIFLFLVTAVLAIIDHVRPLEEQKNYLHHCLNLNGVSFFFSWAFAGDPVMLLVPFAIAVISWISCSRILSDFNPVGQAYLIAAGMLLLSGFSWGIWFITSLDISITTRLLLYTGITFSIFTFPHLIGNTIIMAAVIGKNKHSRPEPSPKEISEERKHFPKVSLHVPCYAEPPEVVINTLNALNNLDYPDFEVLVIDNNTQDPALWKPVEDYCVSLGEKFRFFHVAPLKGAKAGALNWILPHVAPDTEIIGCIDADYVAEPDFLMRLFGHFDDPMLGFVQTSHDYRGWKGSLYQKMCYWEYMPTYKQNLPALSKWIAGYTVGTMCLIRRKALVEAGGWAEWCLTEDSELAIRIHALGYNSICLPDTFGRGLIPDTFAGYKKQRFRWTVGPLQQFKRHFRLFLPKPFGKPSGMSFAQKYFEFIHCTETAGNLYLLFMLLFGSAICFSMIFHGESISPPSLIWTALAAGTPAAIMISWLRYRKLGCANRDILFATLAALSLAHVRDIGALAGLFSRKPLGWSRTNKFKSCSKGLMALSSAKWETVRGFITVLFAGALFFFYSPQSFDLLKLGLIFVLLSGIKYLASPLMAVIAEYELSKEAKPVSIKSGKLLMLLGNRIYYLLFYPLLLILKK